MRTGAKKALIPQVVFIIAGLFAASGIVYAANRPPTVRIESPGEGARFGEGEEIEFRGTAIDLEDGILPGEKLVWTSDIDRNIGEGRSFRRKLSAGHHIIILTATDSGGSKGRSSVFITVGMQTRPHEEPARQKVEKPAGRKPTGETSIAPEAKQPQVRITNKLAGVCYGPFRENEDPDMGMFPLASEIEADIAFIPKVTKAIRTYGCTDTPNSIPELCEKAGIDCYPGAWISKYKTESAKEIEALLKISGLELKCVKALIVGNEVLLRRDMSEEELIGYIRQVKKSTKLPVTTAEIWGWWLKHPNLTSEVDFLIVHVHPYWEGVLVEKAAEYVVKVWRHMRIVFPDKRIVIGETGWPSDGKTVGNAIPSKENQAKFLREFLQLAEKEGIEYFYFELFDEKWKEKFEGRSGAYWGIYNSGGSLKPHNRESVPAEAEKGINRPPRKVVQVAVSAPLVVYSDADSENAFQPSGWMGDMKCIELDKACETNPHSGKTCIRIAYTPGGIFSQGWSGIYWQYPLNNWGDYPGYKLTGASRLTFWLRGENGDERSEFKVGGISNSEKPHRDSFGPLSTGIVKLTKEWKQYTIDLKAADTSNLIGGFCWVTTRWQSGNGCTIYLDDIVFESDAKLDSQEGGGLDLLTTTTIIAASIKTSVFFICLMVDCFAGPE